MKSPTHESESVHSRSSKSDSTSDTSSDTSSDEDTSTVNMQYAADCPYLITTTPMFLVLTMMAVTCLAFSVGVMSYIMLLICMEVHPAYPMCGTNVAIRAANIQDTVGLPTPAILGGKEVPPTMSGQDKIGLQMREIVAGRVVVPPTASNQDKIALPTPAIIVGKNVPPTTFTSKTFQQGGALTSRTVHLDRKCSADRMYSANYFHGGKDEADEGTHNKDGGLHLPSGQHLLVDIKYVDPDFLNSEEKLAKAMIEMINESKATLLSYHCHSLVPMGVSCLGVLLESHVSWYCRFAHIYIMYYPSQKVFPPTKVAIHTWPKDGVVNMDLFTCGAELLVPLLPTIKRLFGIPILNSPHEPLMKWSHKLRGFREDFSLVYNRYENPLEQELGTDILANHQLATKNVLLSGKTSLQHVDVYEWHDPSKHSPDSYERSMSDDGHGSLHPGMFRLDKGLFLDGVRQSSLYGEAAYHEALVHPAMFAHPNPKRVAIIGGGEGATLREILKHKTVKQVVMVEIDEELVKICREHLPEWSDCRDMEGSDADSCFDDSRASVEFIDAFGWFIENFGKDDIKEEKFDVIIMDALDPDRFVAIVGSLYKDNTFTTALYNGLSDDGVVSTFKRMSTLPCIHLFLTFLVSFAYSQFVVQLGASDRLNDPAADVGPGRDKAKLMDALEHVGFKSMHIYDEVSVSFHE
jgi:S-adenosylmethionine/arginine decarboxylase-like enzyme